MFKNETKPRIQSGVFQVVKAHETSINVIKSNV